MSESTALAVVEVKQFVALTPDSTLAEIMRENTQGEKISEYDLDKITVPAGGGTLWTVQDAAGENQVKEIVGIVLGVARRRSYWESSVPSDNPPDCASTDMVRGHGDPGGLCEECPLNEFESASQGKGKACKERRILYVLVEDRMMPVTVSVPPASLRRWKKYTIQLINANKAYWQVVTAMSLSKTKSADGVSYSEITFRAVGAVDAVDQLRAMKESVQSAFGLLPPPPATK